MNRYKIYNAAELADISVALRRRISAWSSAWLGAQDPLVETANAYDNSDAAVIFDSADSTGGDIETVAGEGAVLALSAATGTDLPPLLLGRVRIAAPLCPATQKLLRICLDEFLRCLHPAGDETAAGAAPGNTVSAAPDSGDWQRKGGGWVYVKVSVSGLLLPVLLAPAAVSLDRRPPLSPLPAGRGVEAIGENPIRLLAELGSVGLSIGEFGSLKPGDVLRLGTRFADKIVLTTVTGVPVCRVTLGKNGEQRAVKIERFQ